MKSRPERETENGRQKKRRISNGKPCFEAASRELRFGSMVLKRFQQESDAAEIILLAFEEENWSPRIDDPLPVKDGQEPKQRLRTTITNLNRRLREPLLRFHVLRQATAVSWEFR